MRKAFTLIELLVVIAIIVVMLVLLLPAIQAIRQAAAKAQCASNLRQLALSTVNYETANGCVPPAWSANTSVTAQYPFAQYTPVPHPAGWVPAIQSWFGLNIFNQWNETQITDISKGFLTPYYEKNFVLNRCPSAIGFQPQFASGEIYLPTATYPYPSESFDGWDNTWVTGGYAYNATLGLGPSSKSLNLQTSQTFLFCDAAAVASPTSGSQSSPPLNEAYAFYPPFQADYYPTGVLASRYDLNNNVVAPQEPCTAFRHSGMANVAFLDGHVEGRQMVSVVNPAGWSSGNATAAEYGIGYLDSAVPPAFSLYLGY